MSSASFAPIARLYQSGQIALAEAQCRALLSAQPQHPDANHLLGVILLQSGRIDEALQRLEAAVRARPGNLDAQLVFGSALAMSGQTERARPCFEKIVRQQPGNLQALYNLGLCFSRGGQHKEARKCFARVLARDPGNSESLIGIGVSLAAVDQPGEAVDYFAKADALRPGNPEILENLALAYFESHQPERSLDILNRLSPQLLEQRPKANLLLARIWFALGDFGKSFSALLAILRRWPLYAEAREKLKESIGASGAWEIAESVARQALQADGDWIDARLALASSLFLLERHAEAVAEYRQVLTLQPDHQEALLSLGLIHRELGEFTQSIACLNNCLAVNPRHVEAKLELSLSHLTAGDLSVGMSLLEARFSPRVTPLHLRHLPADKRWLGDPAALAGKRVLVWGEGGIGDEMAFISALPDLLRLTSSVQVECTEKLVPFFARSFPEVVVKPKRAFPGSRQDDFDLHLPMGDLFVHFRQKIDAFPRKTSYFVPDDRQRIAWRGWLANLGEGLKIGVSWRSSMRSRMRSKYHIDDLQDWAPILRENGAVFINLQPDALDEELALASKVAGATIHRPPGLNQFDDIDGAAALIAELDLVVSTGSSVAFIAGAVGAPVWMFHVQNAHWDTLGTSGFPWLPSVNLVSRQVGEGWSPAIGRVADALRKSCLQGNLSPPVDPSLSRG